ncbi:fbh1 [Symbiodinium sp. CCMP2456]|nr:fbh1 [Symbiodinium sp. CCMP2456]
MSPPPCANNNCPCKGNGIIARYKTTCQECWRPISPGQCIIPNPGAGSGWCHGECPDKLRGVLVEVEPVIDPGLSNAGGHAPEPLSETSKPQKCLTEEQLKVLDFQPNPGQILRIEAVAGAGKTTTSVKLADRLLQARSDVRILYVVFNEKAKQEASARFHKRVLVSTSHALAKKRAWLLDQVEGSHPRLDIVAERLGLVQLAEAEVDRGRDVDAKRARKSAEPAAESSLRQKPREKRIQQFSRRQAKFVLKTLDKFLSSDSPQVEESHVFYKALEKKTFLPKLYVEKAQQAFELMCNPVDSWPQTHDGYLKLFQLHNHNLGPSAPPPNCCDSEMLRREGRFGRFYQCLTCEKTRNASDVEGFDVIIIDEAQDFTPCQADVFFRQAQNGAIVYLVGDPRQRMYRWRGARDSFEVQDVGQCQFFLTESFRFGPEVAECANAVLTLAAGGRAPKVSGRGPAGKVLKPGQPLPPAGLGGRAAPVAVVITRTNKGVFQELIKRLRSAGDSGLSWATVDNKAPSYMFQDRAFRPYLKLRNGEKVTMKGEEIETWEELEDLIDDDGDTEMRTLADLVEEFEGNIPALLEKLGTPKEDWREADVAFITAHKAKGLEFDYVELASDFTMPYGEDEKLLPYERIQKPYFQEELNILYVAITRAKRYLRLSPEVAKLLADLGATPSEKLHAPQGRADYLDETRVGDAARWKLFEKEVRQSQSFDITVETVPFPRGPEHNILALPDSLTMEEAQRLVSEALLRWHPDKFLSQLGRTGLASGSLREKLNAVTRELLNMRRSYSLGGAAGNSAEYCIVCFDETAQLLKTFCRQKRIVCRDCYTQLSFAEDANLRRCPQCRKDDFSAEVPSRHCIRDVARPSTSRRERSRSRRRG